MDELQKYTQSVYSGSLIHRLPCPALRKGGMANQILNHSSFYSIASDRALLYCKGSLNYTICFQCCFLYELSVLAHYIELEIIQTRQMGLLFTCPHSTWLIPPETFTMEKTTYPGTPLKEFVTILYHK